MNKNHRYHAKAFVFDDSPALKYFKKNIFTFPAQNETGKEQNYEHGKEPFHCLTDFAGYPFWINVQCARG
jgi:hypothetical protein